MATRQRQPYPGTERKLVIAIDVGTTFSGVSYALLDPGKVPQIQPVTQFVGQREPRGDSKVPSIVCYGQDGIVVAAGAETDPEMNPALAEMDDVIRVEWFKLHLRPPHLAPDQEVELQKLRSFPKNKTPVQVLGDFLRYLFQSTKKYIMESESWSWKSVERKIDFVLSHPNGWEGKQQSQMRKAAITAGLVDNSEASERISFVSEGKASLHFCLNKNITLHNERDGILVIDCGGGTVDVSAYSQAIKGKFKEITQPECHFQGSIFVTCRAKEYLEQRLRNSQYSSEHEIEAMASSFDRVTKCMFDGPNTTYYVKFGGLNYNDPKFDIQSGSIKIIGTQIASFFEPALQDIVRLIDSQRSKSTVTINTVLLVGGFARSNYLFSQLSSHFTRDVSIMRADTTHLNKAVADGAVSYYLDQQLGQINTKYQQTTQLLQERSEELSTAQQFLGKADSISPTEVVRLVEILNAEIAQQSIFILDLLDSLKYRKWTASSNDLEHLLKGLPELLGPRLYDNLRRRLIDPNLEFDDLLTQLALQTGFVNACHLIINDWNPPFWDQGVIFDRIYGKMGRKVGQVVAGKWRALSSTYLRVDREKNKEWLRGMLQQLITVVVGPAQSGDYALPTDIRNKVDDITRRALEIRKHVRGSVTSMDLEVYSVPCGTQFDASQMEDSNAPMGGKGKAENDNRQRKVICTLDMGLWYKKKVPHGKQGEFRDEMGVILKSKVVLDDAFAPESS